MSNTLTEVSTKKIVSIDDDEEIKSLLSQLSECNIHVVNSGDFSDTDEETEGQTFQFTSKDSTSEIPDRLCDNSCDITPKKDGKKKGRISKLSSGNRLSLKSSTSGLSCDDSCDDSCDFRHKLYLDDRSSLKSDCSCCSCDSSSEKDPKLSEDNMYAKTKVTGRTYDSCDVSEEDGVSLFVPHYSISSSQDVSYNPNCITSGSFDIVGTMNRLFGNSLKN